MKRKSEQKIPFLLTAAIVGGMFSALFLLEIRRPLRRLVENKIRRDARNFAVAATVALALSLTEMPVAERLTKFAEKKSAGLLKTVKLPVWLETTLAVILLDYTFYLWHVLTHKSAFLWRFHLAHHVDLEMDASTAFRFHAGEMAISTTFRAAQILVIGVSPFAYSIWQTFMLTNVLFHHSNLRLPENVEKYAVLFFVTPRMHDIHHRAAQYRTDSNWSSGFSIWDRLHKTWRCDFSLSEEPIGVSSYQNSKEVTLPKVLKLPFVKQKPAWFNLEGNK